MTSLVHCEITPITPDNMALEHLGKLKSSARDLLRLVREKYGVIAIEPQLTEDHFDGIIRTLPESCPSHDFKTLAECATKELLYEIAVFSLFLFAVGELQRTLGLPKNPRSSHPHWRDFRPYATSLTWLWFPQNWVSFVFIIF